MSDPTYRFTAPRVGSPGLGYGGGPGGFFGGRSPGRNLGGGFFGLPIPPQYLPRRPAGPSVPRVPYNPVTPFAPAARPLARRLLGLNPYVRYANLALDVWDMWPGILPPRWDPGIWDSGSCICPTSGSDANCVSTTSNWKDGPGPFPDGGCNLGPCIGGQALSCGGDFANSGDVGFWFRYELFFPGSGVFRNDHRASFRRDRLLHPGLQPLPKWVPGRYIGPGASPVIPDATPQPLPWPRVDPLTRPGVPLPPPQPVPYPLVPHIVPDRTGNPEVSTDTPGPDVDPSPRPGTPPVGVQPIPSAPGRPTRPPGGAVVTPGSNIPPFIQKPPPGPYRPSRPPRGTIERKFLSGSRGAAAMMHAAAGMLDATTETADFVASLYKALPKSARTCGGTSAGKLVCMSEQVYRNFGSIDWQAAAANLIQNEIEDRAIGRTHRAAKRAGKRLGFDGYRATTSVRGPQINI